MLKSTFFDLYFVEIVIKLDMEVTVVCDSFDAEWKWIESLGRFVWCETCIDHFLILLCLCNWEAWIENFCGNFLTAAVAMQGSQQGSAFWIEKKTWERKSRELNEKKLCLLLCFILSNSFIRKL